ncbi:MAG: hypothetical protein ACUVS3_07885 [Thermodesulfobacteriota bacterium]
MKPWKRIWICLAAWTCFWAAAVFARAQDVGLSFDRPELSGSFAGIVMGEGLQEILIRGNTLEDLDRQSRSQISASGIGSSGILSVNQSSGDLNNQSNLRVLGIVSEPDAMNHVDLSATVVMEGNSIRSTGGSRSDIIEDSFHNSAGMIGVHQAAGNLNVQRNTLVMVIGGEAFLSEMELGDVTASNSVSSENAGARSDMILDSFSNTSGIVQVTQSAGDLNVLGNNLALSFREVTLR